MNASDKIKAMFSNNKTDQQQLSAQLNSSSNSKTFSTSEDLKKMLEDLQGVRSGHAFWDPTTLPGIGQQTLHGIGTALQPGAPLTHEEEQELSDLEHQHAYDVKKAKLDYFKKLPKEFRQQIVNIVMWEEAVEEINGTTVETSERQRELQLKKQLSGIHGHPFFGGHRSSLAHHSAFDPMGSFRTSSTSLPTGITKEDLLQAHLDASLEEEICEG